jgi:hypothetical protein
MAQRRLTRPPSTWREARDEREKAADSITPQSIAYFGKRKIDLLCHSKRV